MNNRSSQDFAIQIIFEEPYLSSNENSEDVVKTRLRTLILDAVSEPTITASNTVTDHPIVSGDMVADHSYKNPINLSFSGVAAAHGNQGLTVDSEGIKLVDLEELFLKLKNEAYLCEIVKLNVTNKDDIRFSTYSNMVLTNVSLTEHINTLSYSLTFRQVLLASVQEQVVDIDDEYLPNITEPETSSFTDTLIDWEQIDVEVIRQLNEYELLDPKLGEYMKSLGIAAMTAVVAGVVIGTIVVKIMAALTITLGPKGFLIAAIIGAVTIFVGGLVKLFKRVFEARKYRVEQFKKYNDDRKTDKEVQRFCNFMGEIHKQIAQLDEVIHVYKISSDEDQECMLSISNNYYIFTFTTNNTSKAKTCEVTDIEENVRATVQDIKSCPESYNSCTLSNYIFRADESGSYVYIISPKSDEFKLSNCFILVSDINPEEYSRTLSDIIKNALTY